jgi:F420 biosynthesis protein FbiB-like protein
VLAFAHRLGTRPIREPPTARGLNAALTFAADDLARQGAAGLLVLPADVPLATPGDIEIVLAAWQGETVVLCPSRSGGTGALALRPPQAIPFHFGPRSFAAHRRAAAERGLPVAVLSRPNLALDIGGRALRRLPATAARMERRVPRAAVATVDALQAAVTGGGIAGRARPLADRPVEPEAIAAVIAAACLAPAPHHTRPWCFVVLSHDARAALANAMGRAWRRDLQRDGVDERRIEALLERSREQITAAPALILVGFLAGAQRVWPDRRRLRSEAMMFAQSVGAALQNLMLAAHGRGLGSYWISAPLFCPAAVRRALDLPPEFEVQALVALGYPRSGSGPPPRPALTVDDFLIHR